MNKMLSCQFKILRLLGLNHLELQDLKEEEVQVEEVVDNKENNDYNNTEFIIILYMQFKNINLQNIKK